MRVHRSTRFASFTGPETSRTRLHLRADQHLRLPETEYFGLDATPVIAAANKLKAQQRELQPPESDAMFNFDERDLFRLAEAARFSKVHLDRALSSPNRMGARDEPDRDDRIEDHAAERGGRHEGPDRIAVEVMRDVPCRVHQPCDADEGIRVQSEERDRCGNNRIDDFPRPEAAATEIRTACSRNDDGIERASSRLAHKRHHRDEHYGPDDWADDVHHVQRGWVHCWQFEFSVLRLRPSQE